MNTLTIPTYPYDELEENAKERALSSMADTNIVDYEWYDSTIDDAKEVGQLIGISISQIYFSGFSSQGDGACFEGDYTYKPGNRKALSSYAPKDANLRKIASDLYTIQRENFFSLSASIVHCGHYYHPGCTVIDVRRNDDREMTADAEEEIREYLRDFMYWIYQRLEKEYNYLTSRESIEETIRANEYRFTISGDRNMYL